MVVIVQLLTDHFNCFITSTELYLDTVVAFSKNKQVDDEQERQMVYKFCVPQRYEHTVGYDSKKETKIKGFV